MNEGNPETTEETKEPPALVGVPDNVVLTDRPPQGMSQKQIEAQNALLFDLTALKIVKDQAYKNNPITPSPIPTPTAPPTTK
jgi:hypothetical protein